MFFKLTLREMFVKGNLIIKLVFRRGKLCLKMYLGLIQIQSDGQFTPGWCILSTDSDQLTPNLGQIEKSMRRRFYKKPYF